MSLTALRRTALTVAALASTAGLAAAPLLHADAATGRAVTSVSIRTAHPGVRPGGSDVVLGDLRVGGPATAAGRSVTLEARPLGADSFTPVGTATAGTRGGLHETVTPSVTTRYRWAYAGDSETRPSVSGIVAVRVRIGSHPPTRILTTLSIRAARHVVRLNGSNVVMGQLRAGRVPLAHRNVVLVSRPVGTTAWIFDGARMTQRRGRVAFTVAPATDTAYRLVFLGTGLLRPSHSGIVRILTRPDLTIAADPTSIARGGSTTISGTASDQGTPVAGASVQLLARRAGSQRVRVLGTGTTGTDGSVAFTASPGVTTYYRLHLVASTGVRAALSGATRVLVQVPTSLSIRGRATSSAYVVSGGLRGGGNPLAHRTVTLLAQAPGSSDWTTAGTASTNRNGVVSFSEPLAPGTGYRLAYAGGPRFAPSSSGTVES